jgi:DNA topoisomerase II
LTDNEIRVAQLAAYVSENACYHHGEVSLQGAIIGMAQNFRRSKQHKSSSPQWTIWEHVMNSGKDAGQPRYIYTLLEKITTILFNKLDNGVLTYLNDDGIDVEPEYYVPILPLILVNGGLGIGTGFSTNIPSFNPKDIVKTLKHLLKNDDVDTDTEMTPWYMGFKGKIEKKDNKFVSRGIYTRTSPTKITITELPVFSWTEDYKGFLEEMCNKDLKQYESNSTDKEVHFTLHFPNSQTVDNYMRTEANGLTKFENDFKLASSKNLNITNMYLYNYKGQIKKYDTPYDIIKEYANVRLDYYNKRKNYLLDKLDEEMKYMQAKIKFIKSIVSNELPVSKMQKKDVELHLEKEQYPLLRDSYDYLMRIPIYNFTMDKVEEVEKEYEKHGKEKEELKNKDIKDMWIDELEQFEKEYDKFMLEYDESKSSKSSSTKNKK